MPDLTKQLSWDDLRIVKAIGEAGNLARAAAAIGVNASTIFRRLEQMEQLLGHRMFERRRDGYIATATGAEVVALAQRVEMDIVGLTNRLSGLKQDVSGDLRITTSDSLALNLITPIVGEFLSLYPNVKVHMCIGNAPANLAKGESDVAVRATQKPPQNMLGRKLAAIAWAVYGRRTEFVNNPPAADDLRERRWVSYSQELAELGAARLLDERVDASHICYRVNSVQGVAAAIGAGLGVGYLPCMLGDIVPSLMRIEPIEPRLSDELWLLTHPELKRTRRVRVFLDYCAAAIERQRSLIVGVGDIRTIPNLA